MIDGLANKAMLSQAIENANTISAEIAASLNVPAFQVKSAQAIADELLVAEREPRDAMRGAFTAALNAANRNQSADLAVRLERASFNFAIDACQRIGIERYWTNNNFVHRYSAECGRILQNLDPTSFVGSSYLAQCLFAGTIKPEAIHTLDNWELAPASSQKTRDRIQLQMSQKIAVKSTDRHQCARCKTRSAEIRQLQTRAIDELVSFQLRCLHCGNKWTIC